MNKTGLIWRTPPAREGKPTGDGAFFYFLALLRYFETCKNGMLQQKMTWGWELGGGLSEGWRYN